VVKKQLAFNMRSTKSYSFKIVIFLILLGSMAMFYWIGFHKKNDAKYIPQNADAIVMADVKNIRNHFIFSFLKNPSQWSTAAFGKHKKPDLSDYGIEIPDYLAFFHLENQPVTQWFAVANIENEIEFEKAITKASFVKKNLNNGMYSYYSKAMGLLVIKHSNQILVSNIPETREPIALKTAEDLFLKKLLLDDKKRTQTIGTNNAVTVWIKKNTFLKEDGIVTITLNDQEIAAEGQLKLHSKYRKEYRFLQNPNALLSLGFDFEMIRNQNFIKHNSNQINKMIGFNLDSLLAFNPSKTELVLHEIVEKKEAAISYDYDDDFNPIKKVVVHTSREPSFYFSMQTENSKRIYDYLKTQNAIDKDLVFVNFPLAQTKTLIRKNSLTLEANLKKQNVINSSFPKMAYLQMNFNKLQPEDWHYIIAKNKNFELLKPLVTFTIDLTKKDNFCHFQVRLTTKKKMPLPFAFVFSKSKI
jgi:hypothetical protein